jgi:hypothetical protein
MNPLVRLKQLFDDAFPAWPERWAAYLVAFLAACLIVGAIVGCAAANEHAGDAALTAGGAGVAAAAGGPLWAALTAFCLSLWSGIAGPPESLPDPNPTPWGVRFGFWTLVVLVVGWVATVILANRMDWIPDKLRKRQARVGRSSP